MGVPSALTLNSETLGFAIRRADTTNDAIFRLGRNANQIRARALEFKAGLQSFAEVWC